MGQHIFYWQNFNITSMWFSEHCRKVPKNCECNPNSTKNIYCLYIVSCNLDYTSVSPSEPYLSENRAKAFLPFLIIAHIMEQIIQFELHLFISFKKRRIWNKIWKKTLRWKKGNVYWNKVLNNQLDAPNQRYQFNISN